jgi:hypothetical protein
MPYAAPAHESAADISNLPRSPSHHFLRIHMQATRSCNFIGIVPAVPFMRIDSNEVIESCPLNGRAMSGMNSNQVSTLAASIVFNFHLSLHSMTNAMLFKTSLVTHDFTSILNRSIEEKSEWHGQSPTGLATKPTLRMVFLPLSLQQNKLTIISTFVFRTSHFSVTSNPRL